MVHTRRIKRGTHGISLFRSESLHYRVSYREKNLLPERVNILEYVLIRYETTHLE